MAEHDAETKSPAAPRRGSRATQTGGASGTKATKSTTTRGGTATGTGRAPATRAGSAAKTPAARKTTATKTTTRAGTKSAAEGGAPARPASPRRGTNLVIVESPAKARTIAKYLGAGYRVQASMGHVRDLPKSKLGVDVEHGFAPQYLVSKDKTQVVKELKGSVQAAGQVYLATDPDREGEAIAWHLMQATDPDPGRVHRVVFHEITPGAVRAAMANPRDIDMHLVDAQQARRVLDRLVGYKVSPLLWKKVKGGLSAGRVQTAALRLIVEREREIEAFVPVEYWSIEADLAKLDARGRRSLHAADRFRASLNRIGGAEGTVGLITYMRTDSTAIAASAQDEARGVIAAKFGPTYLPDKPPVYTRKAKGAQEAHEAVRPSSVARDPEAVRPHLTAVQYRLYKLIWQRFVASQMRPALLDSTTVDIDAGRGLVAQPAGSKVVAPYSFRATGSVVKFPGFLAVYREGRDDGADEELDKDALPPLAPSEPLDLLKLTPEQHFTQPPPRFTEASLVKALEEQGIGRPSTYAATVATLQTRFYVEVEEKRLRPTDLGRVVNDILVEHFPQIFDIGFTSRLEEELDEIAAGERPWVPVLQEFYGPFAASVERAEGAVDRVKVKVADEATDIICDQCGKPMVIKLGRFGKFIACTGFPECKNTKNIAQGTGVACPKCKAHEIVVKRSRKGGRTFYGCNGYPACDFTLWDRPLPTPCPNCGGLMVEAGKRGSGARCTACGNTSRTDAGAAREELATAG